MDDSRYDKTVGLRSQSRLSRFWALVVACIVTLLIVIFPFNFQLLAKLGYAGVFVGNLLGSATVILPVPSIMAAFVGGAFLHPALVGVLAGLGSGLGEINGYLAGYGGSAVIENRDWFERIKPWIAKYGAVSLFTLAALPNPLFDLAGIAAGSMRYPFFKFLLVTCSGKITKGLVLAYLGAGSWQWFGPLFG